MTKQQFKTLWESDERGGGITYKDIAVCAQSWGLYATPRTAQMDRVRFDVLRAAHTVDAEEYAPSGDDD